MAERRTVDVSLERVLGGSFAALQANALVACAISFLLSAVPDAAWGFQFGFVAGGGYGPTGRGSAFLILAVVGILGFAVSTLAQGALIQVAAAHREGRRAGLGEALEVGLRSILPMMGRNILAGVAIGLAAVALLVPAALLYVVWAVSAPALVLERLGVTDSLERSRALTRGARWQVFAVQLLLLVMQWGLALAQNATVATGTGTTDTVLAIAVSAAVTTFVTAFSPIAHAMLYFELRDAKEGPPTDRLAEIFR